MSASSKLFALDLAAIAEAHGHTEVAQAVQPLLAGALDALDRSPAGSKAHAYWTAQAALFRRVVDGHVARSRAVLSGMADAGPPSPVVGKSGSAAPTTLAPQASDRLQRRPSEPHGPMASQGGLL